MSQTGRVAINFTVGGISFSSNETRTAEGAISHIVPVPAGIAGVVNGTTIIDGLVTGHGLQIGDAFDLHWTVAGVLKVRQGLVVDTANANDIIFDATPAGTGDALPADDTAVVLGVQVVVSTDWDGDTGELTACKSDQITFLGFRTAAAEIEGIKLTAGASWFWLKDYGYDNPFASDDMTTVLVSNGSTTASTVFIGILYQSVP